MSKRGIRYSKLLDFVQQSRGSYEMHEDGEILSITFNSHLPGVREHYDTGTIRIRCRKDGDSVYLLDAEADYGGEDKRKISLESLEPWLISVDEESAFL